MMIILLKECDTSSLTHLSDVERCEADSEDDQHCAQQLDSPPSHIPEKLQLKPPLHHQHPNDPIHHLPMMKCQSIYLSSFTFKV